MALNESGSRQAEQETKTHSPEEQAIIDRAIDLMLESSTEGLYTLDPGFRSAAVTLAFDLDGTQRGVDRVADFYSRRCVEDSPHPDPDELDIAHQMVMEGVSREIGERVLATEIQIDRPLHAEILARRVFNRELTEDELLTLVNVHTHGASRGMTDRADYLELARKNNASKATIRKIQKAFNDFDVRWESELL